MATPSDQLQLPPWETASQTEAPPWEGSAPVPAEVPPWQQSPVAVPQGEVSGAVPTPGPNMGPDVPDAGAMDSASQVDKSNAFLSRWRQNLQRGWEVSPLNPAGARHMLGQFATGVDQTVLGILKAPGQAVEAFQNWGAEKPFEPTWKAPVSSTLVTTSRLIDKFQKEFIDDPRTDIPFEDQLAQGAGSAFAFMGTGALLGAAGYSPAISTAATGGAVGASQQYDDAIAHGATPEQAGLAYLGGAAFGMTEAVPGALFLQKLNRATGGKVLESIKTYGTNLEGSTAWEAVKGGLEEALQEGVQQVGTNWVAADLAGYDPNRTLGEGFWQNVATGGIIGSMLGGGINMLRNGEKNRILKEMEVQRQAKLESGDIINDISGSFTPVGDLVALRFAQGQANAEYEARASNLVDIATQNAMAAQAGQTVDTDIIPARDQGPNYLGNDTTNTKLHNEYLTKQVDSKIEKSLPEKPTPYTVAEALDHTPVVVVDGNPYKELLDAVERNLAKQAAKGNTTSPGVKTLQLRRIELMAKSDIASRIMSQIKSYTAAFQQVFGPDYKLVLTAYSPSLTEKGTAGFFNYTSGIQLPSGKSTDVGYMFVDIDNLATEIYNNKKAALNDATKQARRQLFETINHELGHGIAITNMRKIYETISNPASTPAQRTGANRLLTLMTESYQEWLKTAAGKAQPWLLMTQFGLERARTYANGMTDEQVNTRMTGAFPKKWPGKEYLLSFDEFFAEMTSRLATQGALADPIMTKYFSSVLPQYQELFNKMPAFVKSQYGDDWRSFLVKNTTTWKVNQELEKVQAGGSSDLIGVLRKGLGGLNPDNFAGMQEHLDRFDKLISYGFNLIQLAKENPHIEPLQRYLKATAAWAEYQRNFQAEANEVYKGWRELGKLEAAQLSSVLFDEALNRKLTDPAVLQKLLSAESQEIYKQIRQQLSRVLEEMRQTSLTDLRRTILDNEELLNAQIQQVNDDFDKMAQQGYFPFIRFGRYTITARAKEDLVYNGNTYKKGQLISFPAFETEKERNEVLAEIRADLGAKANVASSVMRETDFVIQGMPRSLLRSLRNKLEATGDFTTEQANAFEAAAAEAAPFRNFRKHMLKKKGIHGYSEDAMRSFAAYIRGAAGHISRVRFNDDLRGAIAEVQDSVEVIKETGGRADERQEIRHWLDRHFSYVMNPGNELAALRGVGFVAYLGFNVKSAFVNLTQLVTTVGPYLASRYGDTQAIAEMSKATWTLKDWVSKRKQYLSAMDKLDKGQANQGETQKALLARMISRGQHEGWLDQSLATELAIAASENNLDRGLYLPKARRFWHEVSRYSALPFHLVEKLNRYITAISAYNLELKSSGSYEKAVLAAKEANWSANYENARWNRPEFMRGKKSVFFLFGNYLQNTLYFATRDPGAIRYWLGMLILAGVLGLPGADDVADLADFAGTYLNRLLGLRSPKTQIRVELRNRLEELGANPDLILHGLAQDSFGLGHVGELTGIPIPHLDVSRSVGMSDVIPGTELPGMLLQNEPNDIIAAAAADFAGAGGSLVDQYYRAALSPDPDLWKKSEKLLPLVAAKNLSKAVRLATRGGEYTQSGNVIAQFDPYDPRTAMELVGQGLGFQPSELTQGWERQIAVADQVQYYKVQQELLLRQMNYARFQQDQEAVADMLQQIRRYNAQVPQPEMGISVATMKDSFKSYLEKRKVAGMGLAAEKKYRRLQESAEQSYPDPLGNKNNDPSAIP